MSQLESFQPIEEKRWKKIGATLSHLPKGILPSGQVVFVRPTDRLVNLCEQVQKGAVLIATPEGDVSTIEKKYLAEEAESLLLPQIQEEEISNRVLSLFYEAFQSAGTEEEIQILEAVALVLADIAVGVLSKEKFLRVLPPQISELRSQALPRVLLESSLRKAEASGEVRREVVRWIKDNWDRIATPEGFPKPLEGRVVPIKGVKYYTDPTTGKVVIDIAGKVIGQSMAKSVKSVLRILPDGSIEDLVRYAPIKKTEAGVALSERKKQEQLMIFQRDMTGQTGFGKAVSGGEIYWRERLKAGVGKLPETIGDLQTITYIGKHGFPKTRYFSKRADGDLLNLINTRPRNMKQTLLCLRDGVEALAFVHQMGIMHLDVKPENILYKGTAGKLIDFGFAQNVSPLARTANGTIPYVSPEVFLYRPISPKSDIFSLGVLLSMLADPRSETFPALDTLETAIMDREDENRLQGKQLSVAEYKLKESNLKACIDKCRARMNTADPLQRLTYDCLAWEKDERPSSEEALARLESILASM